MGSIVRVSRKRQVVVPQETRGALGVSVSDELVSETERGRAVIKPRPRSYAKHMLGLHKHVWKGLKPRIIWKERERVGRKSLPAEPEKTQRSIQSSHNC